MKRTFNQEYKPRLQHLHATVLVGKAGKSCQVKYVFHNLKQSISFTSSQRDAHRVAPLFVQQHSCRVLFCADVRLEPGEAPPIKEQYSSWEKLHHLPLLWFHLIQQTLLCEEDKTLRWSVSNESQSINDHLLLSKKTPILL